MHACPDTDQIVAFCLHQLTPEEELSLKAHTSRCAACRLKLTEVAETIELLPLSLAGEMVVPPPGLRERVLRSAAAQSQARSRRRIQLPMSVAVAAACAALAVGGYALWQVQTLQDQLVQRNSAPPAQRAVRMAGIDAAPSSSGRAFVVDETGGSRIVLYAQGLPALQPGEVYQLWLIKDGKRKSGGVFVVDASGSGSVALWTTEQIVFDSLGITREPDANGLQPRGSKVMGSI